MYSNCEIQECFFFFVNAIQLV